MQKGQQNNATPTVFQLDHVRPNLRSIALSFVFTDQMKTTVNDVIEGFEAAVRHPVGVPPESGRESIRAPVGVAPH